MTAEPTSPRARILVVDDEAPLVTGLKLNFELEGYDVDTAASGRAAAQLLLAHSYALIVLDGQLPDIDGFALCRRLREAGDYTPVIMLTVRDTAEDRVTGLEVGADDYLTKPFELSELLARVRSQLRRRRWERAAPAPAAAPDVLRFADAEINFSTHTATASGKTLPLTQLEIDLLRHFASNAGRVLTRDELLEKVWKLRAYKDTRTVDNFIVRLRRYFEPDPANPVHFLSVRGSGYKFVP